MQRITVRKPRPSLLNPLTKAGGPRPSAGRSAPTGPGLVPWRGGDFARY